MEIPRNLYVGDAGAAPTSLASIRCPIPACAALPLQARAFRFSHNWRTRGLEPLSPALRRVSSACSPSLQRRGCCVCFAIITVFRPRFSSFHGCPLVPAVSRQRFRPVPSLLRSYPLKGCAPAPPGIGSFPRLFTLSFIPLLRNKFRHAKIN